MPRLTQPELSYYDINWGTNTAQKLSGKTYVNPAGQTVDCSQVSVTCHTSGAITKFIATAVKDGRNYGFINDVLVDCEGSSPTGTKVSEQNNIAADTDVTFTVKVSNHLTAGEGLYRIGLYVKNAEGTWNYEYLFVTYGSDKFVTSDGKDFIVPVNREV